MKLKFYLSPDLMVYEQITPIFDNYNFNEFLVRKEWVKLSHAGPQSYIEIEVLDVSGEIIGQTSI